MRTEKILVEIHDKTGIRLKKKYPIEENRVIIVKAKSAPGGASYEPTFDDDCIRLYYEGRWPFRRLKRKLLLWNGANHCISFKSKDIDKHEPTRDTVKHYARAEVFKAAGASVQRLQVPVLVYVLIVVNIMISILGFLVGSGKIQFV